MNKDNVISENPSKEKFSGWLVVLGCFLGSFLAIGLIVGTASLFMAPITEELGISAGTYSTIFLLTALTSAVGALVFAPLLQKGNTRLIIMAAIAVTGLMYLAMGFMTQFWQLLIANGIINFTFAAFNQVGIPMLITAWFDDKKSIALSLSFSGNGLGTAVWSLVLGRVIAQGNWRMAYIGGGAMVAILVPIIIFLTIRKSPESVGQKRLTKKESADGTSEEKDKRPAWEGIERKIAVKTKSFYMIALSVICLGWLAAGVATHSVNYLIGIGWPSAKASSVQSLYGIVTIVALLLGGILFDKLGFRNATFLSLGFAVAGLVSLILSDNHAFGYLYAVLYGMSLCLPRLMPAMLVSEVFGVKDYGNIYSLVQFIFLGGCALGALLTGVLSDLLGYKTVWAILIGLSFVTAISVTVALMDGRKLREKYPDTGVKA